MTAPRAYRSLRGWLRHLRTTSRLAQIRPGVALTHELAAIDKRLDGEQAALFPQPGGHALPMVSEFMYCPLDCWRHAGVVASSKPMSRAAICPAANLSPRLTRSMSRAACAPPRRRASAAEIDEALVQARLAIEGPACV